MERERAIGVLLGIADGMEAQGMQRVATTIREAALCLADEPMATVTHPVYDGPVCDHQWEAIPGVDQGKRCVVPGCGEELRWSSTSGGDPAKPNRMTQEAMRENLDGATRYDSAEAIAEDLRDTPDDDERNKVDKRYSGVNSDGFWRRVNTLIGGAHRELYSLGVALQNLEGFVLKALVDAETELPEVHHSTELTHGDTPDDVVAALRSVTEWDAAQETTSDPLGLNVAKRLAVAVRELAKALECYSANDCNTDAELQWYLKVCAIAQAVEAMDE